MEFKIHGKAIEHLEELVIEAKDKEEALAKYQGMWERGELYGNNVELVPVLAEPDTVELFLEEAISLMRGNAVEVVDGVLIQFPDCKEIRNTINILDRYDNAEYWEEQ